MTDIDQVIRESSGIRLDIGCGEQKQPGFVGYDRQALPGVEIVHDWNVFPWPLPDGCVLTAIASHVIEHVSPIDGHFIRWMDELWRVCKAGAEVAIAFPHGSSQRYLQDPTHCGAHNEDTFFYFDPRYNHYLFYRPKPWLVRHRYWSPAADVEVILVKLSEVEAEAYDATL